MSTEDKDILAGFEHIANYMSRPTDDGISESTPDDSSIPEIDPEELAASLGDNDGNEPTEDPIEDPVEDPIEDDDPVEDDDPIDPPVEDFTDDDPVEDLVEIDETEVVTNFIDLFNSELGWELEDDNKPKDIKELINHMSNIIDENSVPTFANEDIKNIDEFVRNGGNLYDYLESTKVKKLDLDSPNLDDETVQKEIVAEHLRSLNYSEDRINKRLQRYEEAGTLEEEAEDAVGLLKEHVKAQEEKLLKEQKERKQAIIKEQQKFISDVENTIEKLDNIHGIPLTVKEKRDLKDYLLKVESDGKTAYQRDYSKELDNLIVSAFYTKNGDKKVKQIKSKAETDAVLKFKKNLKTKRKPKQEKPYSSGGADFNNTLSAISKALTKN